MPSAVELALASVLSAKSAEVTEHRPLNVIIEAMRSELAPKFREIWDARNDREYLRMARRVGKTQYLVRRSAAITAAGSSESMNPYILPTIKSARLVAWPTMKRIVRRHFPDADVNETLSTIRLPVGGTIVLGGCETMADVGRWYGMGFEIAVVDERGNFPDAVLVELDDEAIEPSLMDYGGVFAGSGNPGRVLRGRWFEQTRDDRIDPTPMYTGDARDNPFLRTPADVYFEKIKAQHGWTDASPTFRRQYLGEWVEDAEALVYPIAANSLIQGLPEVSSAGGRLDPHLWVFVIGIDVGYVDATALSVVAAHPHDTVEVVVSTEKHSRMLIPQLDERLGELLAIYPRARVVMDTGGMGKIHAEELTRIFGRHIKPAMKRDKESVIRTTRDALSSRRLLVVDGEANYALRDEASVLGWDEDKRLPDPTQEDHAWDATNYALRELRHYNVTAIRPQDDSELARLERQAAALKAAAMRRASGRTANGRPSWDR